jgi:hypothetical protein
MLVKFRFVILFIFTLSLLVSQEKKRNIAILINNDPLINETAALCLSYLTDLAESELLKNYNDIIISNVNGDIDISSIKKVINHIFSHGINAFFYVTTKQTDNTIDINIKLYGSTGNIIDQNNITINSIFDNEKYISEQKQKEWVGIFLGSMNNVSSSKTTRTLNKKTMSRSFKFEHDFPFFAAGVSALSVKMYFDERMINKASRIFSFFPVDLRISVYPLKYFEVGLFCRFNFDNIVFKYYD